LKLLTLRLGGSRMEEEKNERHASYSPHVSRHFGNPPEAGQRGR